MKKINSFLALAALSATVSTTSCSDDIEDETKSVPTYKSNRITNYTNLIVSANNIDEKRVGLTTGDVKVSNTDPELSYTIEQDSKGYRLVTHVTGDQSQYHVDELTLTAADGRTQSMQVVVDPYSVTSRAALTEQLTAEQDRACQLLGMGVDYIGSVGQTKGTAIIDLKRFLEPENRDAFTRALNISDLGEKADNYYKKSTSLTEVSETIEKKMGMKVKFPLNCLNVSAGFDKTHFSQSNTKEEREYLIAGVTVGGFEAKLNPFNLCKVKNEITGKNEKRSYAMLLNSDFNDILNNPDEMILSEYPSTEEGMTKLLDNYGTHVVTEAQFGAYAQISYSMNKSSKGTKTEDCLAYELGFDSNTTVSKSGDKTIEKKDDASNSVAKIVFSKAIKPVPASFNFTNSIKEGTSNLHEEMKTDYHCTTAGGLQTGSNMDLTGWKPGKTEEMVPLTYATAATLSNVANGADNPSLIPIYKFCTDKDRRDILERLLTPNDKGVIPYYQNKLDKSISTVSNDDPLVVADVQLVFVKTHNLNDNIVKPLQLKDHWGIERTYYPMVMNDEHPDNSIKNEIGHVFTLNHTSCIGIDENSRINGRLLCYYALDYASMTNGIKNVRLLTDKDYKEHGATNEFKANETKMTIDKVEITAGAGTFTGIKDNEQTRVCAEGLRYLYVTYGDNDTQTSEKITGVAWHIGDPATPAIGSVVAASGGTECGTSNTFSASDKAYFKTYWHTKGNVKCTSTIDDGYLTRYQVVTNNSDDPFMIQISKNWGTKMPTYKLHPVFTTTPIKREMKRKVETTTTGTVVTELSIAYPLPY